MKKCNFYYATAIGSIILSASTWLFEILRGGLCPYCLTERAVIGILGILMLLPGFNLFRLYLSLLFGFYGSYVASRQIFLSQTTGRLDAIFLVAIGSLIIIMGQVVILNYKSSTNPKPNDPVSAKS